MGRRVRWGNVGKLGALIGACVLLVTGPHGCGGAPGSPGSQVAVNSPQITVPAALPRDAARPPGRVAERRPVPRRRHRPRHHRHRRLAGRAAPSVLPPSAPPPLRPPPSPPVSPPQAAPTGEF